MTNNIFNSLYWSQNVLLASEIRKQTSRWAKKEKELNEKPAVRPYILNNNDDTALFKRFDFS